MDIPPPIRRIVGHLSSLPSIGPRQALRLAFHLVNRGPQNMQDISAALKELAAVKVCAHCYFIHENASTLCDICANPNRDHATIAVIEKETDLLSIENTKRYSGRYFIVGAISRTGILEDWQKLRLQALKTQIKKNLGGSAREIILALNPTSNGDFNASLIAKELAPFAKKTTRLGRGLPTGGEIEFADNDTLGAALERRD